ncbi:hypothetical protein Pla108_02350 [Botrimarina colliarenosi]|uniref:Uncharacterized protein n=1 Tax=Botrimarina colliarenosi TaxID=2528001 RepID=A0A5C6AIS0_9BACT|nr:hypothetical protein Pla108_02350 [Botrimarina colliarenosi]
MILLSSMQTYDFASAFGGTQPSRVVSEADLSSELYDQHATDGSANRVRCFFVT